MKRFLLLILLLGLTLPAFAEGESIVYSRSPDNCGDQGYCHYQILDANGNELFSGNSVERPYFLKTSHYGHQDFCDVTLNNAGIKTTTCFEYDSYSYSIMDNNSVSQDSNAQKASSDNQSENTSMDTSSFYAGLGTGFWIWLLVVVVALQIIYAIMLMWFVASIADKVSRIAETLRMMPRV